MPSSLATLWGATSWKRARPKVFPPHPSPLTPNGVFMKRTFYEMLGMPHDADQAQIDTAYALTTAKLNAAKLRGAAEAVTEAQLIRDGYQILSDPAKRARYDAKLSAAESGVQLMFFPEDSGSRRKLGVQTVILLALVLVLSGVVYFQLS